MMVLPGDDWAATLRHEFESEDGTFLQMLRDDEHWDKQAFYELASAMRVCCHENAEQDDFERWLALGFFYIPAYVRAWTSRPEFPRPQEAYWRRATDLLEEFSHWFFWGEAPYDEGDIDLDEVLS